MSDKLRSSTAECLSTWDKIIDGEVAYSSSDERRKDLDNYHDALKDYKKSLDEYRVMLNREKKALLELKAKDADMPINDECGGARMDQEKPKRVAYSVSEETADEIRRETLQQMADNAARIYRKTLGGIIRKGDTFNPEDDRDFTEEEMRGMAEKTVTAMNRIERGPEPSPFDVQVGGSHYKDFAIQPAEFCQRNGLGFCESSAIKYLCRHKSKDGRKDLLKAKHFIDMLIQMEYGHGSEE